MDTFAVNTSQVLTSYLKSGLSVVPVNKRDKYPSMISTWRKYMSTRANSSEVKLWGMSYFDPTIYGVGVVCGKVSEGLEVLDFDNNTGEASDVFSAYINIKEVEEIIKLHDLPIEQSPGGGYHIFFRSSSPEGNQRLAIKDKKAIIETRGEGGLIVCSPTDGYRIISGDLESIPVIPDADRGVLLSWAKTFNEECAIQTIPTKVHEPSQDNSSHGTRPGDYYNSYFGGDVPQVLKSHGWVDLGNGFWRRPGKKRGVSATFNRCGKDTFYVFSSSAHPFESNRGYKPFSVYTILEHGGDFKASAIEVGKKIGNASPRRERPQSNEGIDHEETTEDSFQEGAFIKDEKLSKDEKFWVVKDGGEFKTIDFHRLRGILISRGFSRFKTTVKVYDFLKVTGKVARIYSWEEMRSYVLGLVRHLPDIYNGVAGNPKFKKEVLLDLPEEDLTWLRDTCEECFLFYRNCVVKVTKYSKVPMHYKDLPGVIWESQIINRDYNDLVEEYFDKCDVSEFAKIVSANDIDRLGSYMSVLGYLVHNYKKASQSPVIILYDEDNTGFPSGGSGKGLTLKFVEQMRNLVSVDGKIFDNKERFALQRVSRETQVLAIDDVPRKFNFESLFSSITDGMTINKLYAGEMYLSFKESPKIAISSNHVISGTSDSYTRRMFEIEIHKYFGANRTPVDRFGREFFSGWDEKEWNRFDNFMAYSVQYFLRNGLKRVPHIYVKQNKLIEGTNPDFVAWAEDVIEAGGRYDKVVLLNEYRTTTGDTMTGSKLFARWLGVYAEFKDMTISRCGSGGSGVFFEAKGRALLSDEDVIIPF